MPTLWGSWALCFQAHQEVPGWLEEMSEGSYGSGGFTAGSNYGSHDARGGKVTPDRSLQLIVVTEHDLISIY